MRSISEMSPAVLWIFRVTGAVAIAAISAFVTSFFLEVRPTPSAALTANLPADWSAMNNGFNTRIHKQFPVGSSEDAMTGELQREGFTRNDWSYSTKAEAVATRRENDIVCNKVANVYWRADVQGQLTTVRGEYREAGCL